uniref:7TM GPCR serpentine receptor class x (Srx) domain-containing protein n=1 Tax=Parascaris equorum TaxID=6256 RepID=A0A914R8R8_PAREQ
MPLPLLVLFTAAASAIILLTILGNLLVLCFKARENTISHKTSDDKKGYVYLMYKASILADFFTIQVTICVISTACFVGHEIRYLAHMTLTLYWRIYRLARKRQRALDRGFLMIFGQNMNFLTNAISQQVKIVTFFLKSYLSAIEVAILK